MAVKQPPKKIWQPIHPSVRPLLDPQYVRLHEATLQYLPPDDAKLWDGSARLGNGLPSNGVGPVAVGRTEDLRVCDDFKIRTFLPEGHDAEAPDNGWPLFVWFHGGGFALGDLASDEDLLTRICQAARCVVVTVDYRLAPEHPYPAAVDDGTTALDWLVSAEGGVARYNLDRARVALGGASAGGLLSAATALRSAASASPLSFVFQLLVVPVIDNTQAEGSSFWSVNGGTAPWLTPARMLWYRRMWLPREADWLNWDASVNRAPRELLARLPPTFVAVAERDLLAPEGLGFAEQMRDAGVEVRSKVYEGCTHGLLTYCGKMDKGMELLNDCVDAVKNAFAE